MLLKVILAVFVLVVAGFILVIVLTVEEADKAEITRADYQQVKIGMTQGQVNKTLGRGPTGAKFTGPEPAKPKGSSCDHYIDQRSDATVYRLCYSDGKLVQKVSYRREE